MVPESSLSKPNLQYVIRKTVQKLQKIKCLDFKVKGVGRLHTKGAAKGPGGVSVLLQSSYFTTVC